MKNAAQSGGILFKNKLLILVLALLVGDAAAGLAGRLAGGLALAAAAVLGALAQIAGLDGLNMLHGSFLLVIFSILSVYHGDVEMSMRFFCFPLLPDRFHFFAGILSKQLSWICIGKN